MGSDIGGDLSLLMHPLRQLPAPMPQLNRFFSGQAGVIPVCLERIPFQVGAGPEYLSHAPKMRYAGYELWGIGMGLEKYTPAKYTKIC